MIKANSEKGLIRLSGPFGKKELIVRKHLPRRPAALSRPIYAPAPRKIDRRRTLHEI